MQPAASFLRDKLLDGKSKLNQSETMVLKQFQRDAGSLPLMYGGGAMGFNYLFIYRMTVNSNIKWIRVPLNLLAFGIGASYGLNSATNKLVLNFYSLPDSPIAAEGREWLKKNDPQNPVLNVAVRRLSRQNSLSGQIASSGTSPSGSLSTGRSSLGGLAKSSSVSTSEFTIEEPGMDEFNLVSLGDIAQNKTSPPSSNGNTLKSVEKTLNGNVNVERTNARRQQQQQQVGSDSKVDFHGEDAFSSEWDGNVTDNSAGVKKSSNRPKKHDSKGGERTWDEVRAEWLKTQVSNANGGTPKG